MKKACPTCKRPFPTDEQLAKKKARQSRYLAKVRAILAQAKIVSQNDRKQP